MKLYHVSYNKVDRFIPRVPKERAGGENDDIPRICFSDSIEKCIAAKPSGLQKSASQPHLHAV